MPPHNILRQSQIFADMADLIFKQIAQRLNQLKSQLCRQPPDIVMQFYICRRTAIFRTRLDNIRIKGTLGKELGIWNLRRLRLKSLDKLRADYLALLLRVRYTGQCPQKLLGPINNSQIYMKMVPESRHDIFAFIFSKQTIVNKNTDESFTYRLMNQRSYNG